MKLLDKYNCIMLRYRNGEFGDENLTMSEILSAAGEEKLFENMSLTDVDRLMNNGQGITKKMFMSIKQRKIKQIKVMLDLEQELAQYDIWQYSSGENTCESLAKGLMLDVEICTRDEMPNDVEGMLCPTADPKYNGVIKVLLHNTRKTAFSFMHEIIHYLRDVGVGKKVDKVYTRKIQGKTEGAEEQDVNYLTAAATMPLAYIKLDLPQFEALDGADKNFEEEMEEKYSQQFEALERRFIEVRKILDYNNNYQESSL